MANRMIEALSEENAPVKATGKIFFAAKTPRAEKKELLSFLIEKERYAQLYALFACANLNARRANAEPLAFKGEDVSLEGRYFYLFADCAKACGIGEEEIAAVAFASLRADKTDALSFWRSAATSYLKWFGYADYARAWACFCRFDPDFHYADILLEVDSHRTLDELLAAAIFGRGMRKTALRNILRGYKSEVYDYVRGIYSTLKTDERVSAVRLLLPLKNDVVVGELLREIERKEKAARVLRLLHTAEKEKGDCGDLTEEQATDYLYKAMVEGRAFSRDFFLKTLLFPPFTASERLFFSVYSGKMLTDIVMVDGGRVLNLQNEPIELTEDCTVRVLHPVELNAQTAYLKRLNIEQPFEQIRRRVFLPSDAARRANACMSVAGRLVTVRDFNKNRRKTGFKILSRDRDGMYSQVGLSREGILCAVSLAPVDTSVAPLDSFVQAQAVWFYDEKKVIRFGGKRFTDGIPALSVSEIPLRVFSEFMFAVYELMGCV